MGRARARATSGLWAWTLYCVLPYALELGHEGRHAEAVAFLRELIDEGATPRTPGVMTSVVIGLGALAVQREDVETAVILFEYAGRALLRDGVRTPIDIALYSRYLDKLQSIADRATTQAYRERGRELSLDEALTIGLRAPA
jgi:hypothetical protein